MADEQELKQDEADLAAEKPAEDAVEPVAPAEAGD